MEARLAYLSDVLVILTSPHDPVIQRLLSLHVLSVEFSYTGLYISKVGLDLA